MKILVLSRTVTEQANKMADIYSTLQYFEKMPVVWLETRYMRLLRTPHCDLYFQTSMSPGKDLRAIESDYICDVPGNLIPRLDGTGVGYKVTDVDPLLLVRRYEKQMAADDYILSMESAAKDRVEMVFEGKG